MGARNRKILFLLDNAPCHSLDTSHLRNVQAAFLPPKCTSQLQPLDVGIIKYVKQKYRKFVVQHRLVCTERKQLDKKLYMLDAMHNIASAWDTTTSDTITNSFRHCGFNRSDFCSTSEAAVPVDDEPEFGSLQLLGTFTDYVGADDGVAVCSAVSLDDITKLCVLTLRKLPTRKRWMSRG
ncbi:tigger transposable element-derived protein 6 [Rhipicephalus sanguineus]|uniref:tigger transposable element-derived protein 6 n=1 Tax=Rhipicephalus sanguineus TaxID=34632 RepID=UPI0018958AD9|nr:tigger transposable element-derived protein 6 [Rhipicephalus sanguineus]